MSSRPQPPWVDVSTLKSMHSCSWGSICFQHPCCNSQLPHSSSIGSNSSGPHRQDLCAHAHKKRHMIKNQTGTPTNRPEDHRPYDRDQVNSTDGFEEGTACGSQLLQLSLQGQCWRRRFRTEAFGGHHMTVLFKATLPL